MIYRDLHASIMRACTVFGSEFGLTPEYINFDASVEESELPKSDIMGHMALSFSIDDGIIQGSVQIGCATYDDLNAFRLVKNIDLMLNRLLPTQRIQVYDADSGYEKGLMVILNGTRVMPMAGAKNRPAQFVAIQFACTTTYQLPSDLWAP